MAKTSYVLASFSDNWADEMDLEGWKILTVEEWEAFQTSLKKYFERNDSLEIYFGTNESNTYGSFDDIMDAIGVEDITQEEVDVVSKFFGMEFGENSIFGCLDGYDEDDDE